MFVGSGVDFGLNGTSPPSPVNLTAVNQTVPASGPRVDGSDDQGGSAGGNSSASGSGGKSSGAVGVSVRVRGAVVVAVAGFVVGGLLA